MRNINILLGVRKRRDRKYIGQFASGGKVSNQKSQIQRISSYMLNIHECFVLCLFFLKYFHFSVPKIQFCCVTQLSFETLEQIIFKAILTARLCGFRDFKFRLKSQSFTSSSCYRKSNFCHQLLIISAISHRTMENGFDVLFLRCYQEENNITFLHKHPSNVSSCNEIVIQSNLTSKHSERERERLKEIH